MGWSVHQNIDMCGQGDVEIIWNWRSKHSIEDLKRIVEQKGYSAISVGGFDHAGLKQFSYQLTAGHCKPSQGYTNTLYIWSGGGAAAAEILDGHVMVHPVDYWGNEKKEQKSDGSEVSMKRKVSRRICIGGALDSIEEVNWMRKETKSAITKCKRIGAKGEEDALNDVKNELETGRKNEGVRDVVHAKFTAYPAPARNWQPQQIPKAFRISDGTLNTGLKAAQAASVGWEALQQGDSKGKAIFKMGLAFASSSKD